MPEDKILHVFKGGGPLDNNLGYDSRFLMRSHPENPETTHITEYEWTDEIITSPSGRRARVWRWKGQSG